MIYFAPTPDESIDQRDLIDECPVVSIKAANIRGSVRAQRVWSLYFLPANADLCLRLARVQTPYREHLAKHFADTFSRIGLPQPYETM